MEHADTTVDTTKEAGAGSMSPASSGSALLPVVDLITTKADIDLCLGSGELLPCPFCGHWAMSAGEKTKSGRGVLWTISCTHTTHLYPDCCASVWAVDEDQTKARAKAVARWNRRPNNAVRGAAEPRTLDGLVGGS